MDDDHLAEAARDLARGRWQPAQKLLNQNRTQDVKIHRLQVLAQEGCRYNTVEQWVQHTDDQSAHLLKIYTDVARAFLKPADHQHITAAWSQCESHLQHHGLLVQIAQLTLARVLPQAWREPATEPLLIDTVWAHFKKRLAELAEPAREEFTEGYRQYLEYYSPQWHGSGDEMSRVARELCDRAAQGSPRHVLPLVAFCEQLTASHREGGQSGFRREAGALWRKSSVRRRVTRAVEQWWQKRAVHYATDVRDANYLAYGLVHTGQYELAWKVFDFLGPFAIAWPWGMDDDDPATAFEEHRERMRAEATRRQL
ncbi:hypothetical protein M8C13_07090 [Crossiella sp. SN42]|uniref:hypothetical protein n=1 Tax=Crossiella sp. SN42 TaxID=2944808 RepID=UPI00207D3BED|nr:hypothetical protein [Crossiella sp. SN42]MCO1575522.1 hypothetical protein [Crossiella sp. SN42]